MEYLGEQMHSKLDTLISQCSSWDHFVKLINSLPKGQTKDKGDLFERLTQVYLQTHPTYSSKLKHVYLLNDKTIPERLRAKLNLPKNDEGIDLICETFSGEYWSVQCKYKSDQSSALTYRELSTFNSLSFNVCKGISLGLVVHTSTKPVKKSRLMPKVKEIGLENWLNISDADWKRITKVCRSNKLEPPEKRNPLEHQKAAIADAHEHFVTNKKKQGKLIMPCGTGKSLTAYWIAQSLKAKTIVVAVPSLALVRQSLADWTAEYLAEGIKPEWMAVCSDQTVGSTKDADSTVATVYEMGIPTNPSDEELDSFLKKRSAAPKIIFTTYQSAEKLCSAAQRSNKTFDLLIADEAHKTVGRRDKTFAALLFDENIKIKKRLFMTATERDYNAAKDNVISMDDATIYGTTCHQLTFKKAIEAKIICDYKIVTIAVSETDVQALIEARENLRVKSGNVRFETDAQSLAAGIAVNKAFEEYGIKHALTFHSSIKRAKDFCYQQDNIASSVDIKNSYISSKNSAGERAQLLKAFSEESYSLISNARCLTEGVDIKAIDCVTFADPKKSTVDIVQAAGRAMRQSKETGKKCGYIVLPLLISKDETLEDIQQSNKFAEIVKIITSLSTQDERIKEDLKNNLSTKDKASDSRIIVDEDLASILNVELSIIEKSLRTEIWRGVGKANWMPFEEARAFVRSLGLETYNEWTEYRKSVERPHDLPTAPDVVYQKCGWVNHGDWLGTFNINPKNRTYLPFSKAREYSRGLKLKNTDEWKKLKLSELPEGIPKNPHHVYKESGWTDWVDFLNTDNIRRGGINYMPYKDAENFVRNLALTSAKEWTKYCKTSDRPQELPTNPDKQYSKNGWIDWNTFLGTNKEQFLNYSEAKIEIHKLGFNLSDDYNKHAREGLLPSNIPRAPEHYYKSTNEWVNWRDFLGTSDASVKFRNYLTYDEAKKAIKKFNIKSSRHWKRVMKKDVRPHNVPAWPPTFYADYGWKGWTDFLSR